MRVPYEALAPTSGVSVHELLGYRDYRDYKPWLRDDFVFRCVFCLEREAWYPNGAGSFGVDHLVPQSKDRNLICEYGNLVYACNRCNAARQDAPVPDPTRTALGTLLQVHDDGTISAVTPEGQDLIDLLHLDKAAALAVRQRVLRVLALAKAQLGNPQVHQVFVDTFGFPADLPDLRNHRPPGGNARRGSEETCSFVLRAQGELPEVY